METNKETICIQTNRASQEQGFKYNEEGRRYHGDDEVAYMLPNDDDEQNRLHKQHLALRYSLQRNYSAPVTTQLQEGINVLDSGCGPASWTIDLANEFPKSKFYGIDISPISPAGSALPPPANVVQLDVGNIAKTLSYPDNFFDYIHQRLLVTALTSEDWNNVLKELFRVLKPGGYIELAELSFFDLTDVGPYMEKYLKGCMYDFTQKCIQEAKFLPPIALISFGARDIPKKLSTELEDRLLKAGFVNEVLQVTPLPLNHDGKGGELLWNDLKHACLNSRIPIAKIYPEWEDVKLYEEFVEAMGEENRQYKTCINWYACYAQKPLE